MISATENKIRIIALFVFISALLFIYTNSILIPIFLTLDFALRGFGYGKYSVLAFLSSKIVKNLKTNDKPIFFPPKQFSAKIGFVFSISLLVFHYFQINTVIITIILGFCAALEAFFSFCVGCIVYNYIQKVKLKFA